MPRVSKRAAARRDLVQHYVYLAENAGDAASEESMREALASLSRDDALFTCARINAMVSGFGPALSNHERQKAAISQLCSLEEMRALMRVTAKRSVIRRFGRHLSARR